MAFASDNLEETFRKVHHMETIMLNVERKFGLKASKPKVMFPPLNLSKYE